MTAAPSGHFLARILGGKMQATAWIMRFWPVLAYGHELVCWNVFQKPVIYGKAVLALLPIMQKWV